MRILKNVCLILAIAMSLCLCSCSSNNKKKPMTTTTVINEKYSWGTYTADFNATLGQLDKAVRRTCARARLVRDFQNFRTTSVEYRFHDIEKIPVSITIKELPEDEGTRLTIRVDRWGDKDACELLVIAMDEELRLMSATPQK